MILHGENLNSAGSNDYRIQIEAVGRCAVTQVTATEIHCRPDLSSIAESVIATIQVSCSLSTTFVIRGREGEEGGGGEERGRRGEERGRGGRRWRGEREDGEEGGGRREEVERKEEVEGREMGYQWRLKIYYFQVDVGSLSLDGGQLEIRVKKSKSFNP